MLFAIVICSQHCAKEKNTPLFTTNVNSLWVELCTTVNNIAVHIGTDGLTTSSTFWHVMTQAMK